MERPLCVPLFCLEMSPRAKTPETGSRLRATVKDCARMVRPPMIETLVIDRSLTAVRASDLP